MVKSSSVVTELNLECTKCQEGLVKASQSNEELHRAMEIHIANLRILASPLNELQKMLPSVSDQPRCVSSCFRILHYFEKILCLEFQNYFMWKFSSIINSYCRRLCVIALNSSMCEFA